MFFYFSFLISTRLISDWCVCLLLFFVCFCVVVVFVCVFFFVCVCVQLLCGIRKWIVALLKNVTLSLAVDNKAKNSSAQRFRCFLCFAGLL